MADLLEIKVTNLPYVDSALLFELVASEPWAMFLDSGTDNSNWSSSARFDILAIEPQSTLIFDGKSTSFNDNGRKQSLYGDPLDILKSAIPKCDISSKVAYLPGAYGYFSYDLARQYENLPSLAKDDEELPQMAMGIYYVVLVVDNKRQRTRVIRMGDSPNALALEKRWLDLVLKYQDNLVAREIEQLSLTEGIANNEGQLGSDETSIEGKVKRETLKGEALSENFDWQQYQQAFSGVREYIKSGDCYQVNLTKRFSAKVTGNTWNAYKSLREESPAPYGCYLNLPFAQVLSNSPESFIKCRDKQVVTSPIKGTRPRNLLDARTDKKIAEKLLNSEKDRAENLMIVDLMRNDLGRACEVGSVKVLELFTLHSFANVHHLISKIIGTLKPELHSLDLLRYCFPGGSITGAPKIRAMEVIEELEPTRRGLYCGAVGYVGANGDLDTSIAIRTIVVKDGVARFSAGGGLVIDSEVEDEYQELNYKISMLMSSVMAEKGTFK